jgi:hypothetical protein
LSGAAVGFISWLLALGIPFLIYGSNTLFLLLYTWPFFSLCRCRGGRHCAALAAERQALYSMRDDFDRGADVLLFLWLLG